MSIDRTKKIFFWVISVDIGGKSDLKRLVLRSLLLFLIFLDTDPHLASVCVISISFSFRDMSCVCVCGNMCKCVLVSTNLESPPIMGNLGCDWAPMSNRFYLV
jgi:hypothetical protein